MEASLDTSKVNPRTEFLENYAKVIGSIISKLESGVYPTEATTCFCGSVHPGHQLTSRDRYMIPHRMVICPDCSIIRANPRMTAAAYKEFYNNEYRPLYDGWSYGHSGVESEQFDTFKLVQDAKGGNAFVQFLDYFNLKPKVVVDIGSNLGGMLLPLKERGATCYGVEVYEHGIEYSREHGLTMFHTIEEVVEAGIKADLIIMQDVIEHLTDLHEMKKLIPLLAPGGYLYIYTPGLFKMRKIHALWQNAHTYQFCSETLNYVMERMGFEAAFRDENIDALYKYSALEKYRPTTPPKEWGVYIMEHLRQVPKRRIPPIHCINKFDAETQFKTMDAILGMKFPDLDSLVKASSGSALVVGGGPSVGAEVETIRRMQSEGSKLFVIERMYPWCHQHNLKPDYVVVLDSSDDVVEGFTHIQPGVTHLLGASCHPKAAVMLKDAGASCYVFASVNPYMKPHDLWHKHGYEKMTVINSGGSVTLSGYSLAATLGFKDIHMFGMDLKIQVS